MKRAGQLLEAIADAGNLRLAFWKAAKGKRAKADCRAFQARLDANLTALRADLLASTARVGDYHYFTIHDPKERTICAASFRERVLHHALMNVCEPVLERAAIFDSYACRRGKGQLAAVRRAAAYAGRYGWFLKMDIRKYFNSVDHDAMRGLLRRKFKDAAVLAVFDQVLASYQTAPGRGLPIGNLTSQHFANFYLGPLDRFVKEGLRHAEAERESERESERGHSCPLGLPSSPGQADRNVRAPARAPDGALAYVRYMDDFVVWGDSGAELRAVWQAVEAFLAVELRLELKPNVALNKTAFGMDFLGYRLHPDELRLARRSKLRFARKFHQYEREHAEGRWTERHLQQRVQALVAFTLPAQSRNWRKHVMKRFGVVAHGLEPGDPRRQLEQQREQLPLGDPQQQQPDEPEQQQWFPRRPGPSSA